jgi:hypothetical protein
MNCPTCNFPILSSTDLGTLPSGQRVLGTVCTHCGRVAKLGETEIRSTTLSATELEAKQNRNT